MDGSFANQVLAQIHLYERRFAELPADSREITLTVLPKSPRRRGGGADGRRFRRRDDPADPEQAEYIGVSAQGPFKPESYRY